MPRRTILKRWITGGDAGPRFGRAKNSARRGRSLLEVAVRAGFEPPGGICLGLARGTP